MNRNNSINGIHARRLKAIRPFVDFNFDLRKPLSEYQKRKIKTYFDEVHELTARPYHVYRPRTKKRLKTAQSFAQHEKQLPGLKVAFIPTNGIEKPKIRFNKKDELITSTRHVTTHYLQFNKKKLISDPKKHVAKIIASDPQAKAFTILAGKYEIPRSYGRSRIAEGVAKLTVKYGDKDKNNYFGNWMVGLNSHHYHNQETFDAYRNAKQKAKVKLKSARKNKKRRENRGK